MVGQLVIKSKIELVLVYHTRSSLVVHKMKKLGKNTKKWNKNATRRYSTSLGKVQIVIL